MLLSTNSERSRGCDVAAALHTYTHHNSYLELHLVLLVLVLGHCTFNIAIDVPAGAQQRVAGSLTVPLDVSMTV
jgi:hypothetical protein